MAAIARIKRGETLELPAPAGARRLRMAGAGRLTEKDVADGRAGLSASETADLPPGRYRTEWEVASADGSVSLPDGPIFEVVNPLARDSGTTFNEQLLDAMRKALPSAFEGTQVSVSVGDANFAFEDREALLRELAVVERRVKAERGIGSLRLWDVS